MNANNRKRSNNTTQIQVNQKKQKKKKKQQRYSGKIKYKFAQIYPYVELTAQGFLMIF